MANWNFFLFLLFFSFLPREDIQSQLHYEKTIIFYLFQFSNFSLIPYYLRYSSPSFIIIIIIISYEDERECKSSSSNFKDILIKVNASVPNASFRFRSLK